uniref:CFAP91 domain-containing protein n=1 Tax=Caenorhabditis tropicalis TaxID=1561998 RepID=A0A1I7UN32_9PELO
MLPQNEKDALFTVDDQIQMLERRLNNAKAARDAFVHHLKGKYPNWTPPLPVMSYQAADFPVIPHSSVTPLDYSKEPLIGRLATSQYQWDVDRDDGRKERQWIRSRPNFKALYAGHQPMDIPISGPLLETDIRRSRIRLREISEELRSLRIDRMTLTTQQWMQEHSFQQHHKGGHLNSALHFGSAYDPHAPDSRVDHLDQAMADLARIQLTETDPVETPRTERRVEIEMEEVEERIRKELEAPPTSQSVRVQDPLETKEVPPVIEAPLAPPPVEAPPPPAQAPPPVQAPPPSSSDTISNLLSSLGIGKPISDDEEDSPR